MNGQVVYFYVKWLWANSEQTLNKNTFIIWYHNNTFTGKYLRPLFNCPIGGLNPFVVCVWANATIISILANKNLLETLEKEEEEAEAECWLLFLLLVHCLHGSGNCCCSCSCWCCCCGNSSSSRIVDLVVARSDLKLTHFSILNVFVCKRNSFLKIFFFYFFFYYLAVFKLLLISSEKINTFG